MKHLFFALFCFVGIQAFAQLDTVQCSNQFPQYVDDAKYLALREIIAHNDPYKDSVLIPISHYIPILRDLNAIAQYGNVRINGQYPYARTIDSIFGLLNIHTRTDAQARYVDVTVNGNQDWWQNISNDSVFSGNDTLDNLANQYSLYYSSAFHINNTYYFGVASTYPINMRPIVNAISTMANTYASISSLTGDGSNIYLADSGSVRHYTFRYGGGDCPSGCTLNYYWKFSVYPNCIVEFDTSYGFLGWQYFGLKNIDNDLVKVYPNPTVGQLNIDLGNFNSGGVELKISNTAGAVIKEFNIIQSSTVLDLSSFLAAGIYNLEFVFADRTEHRRLVVY